MMCQREETRSWGEVRFGPIGTEYAQSQVGEVFLGTSLFATAPTPQKFGKGRGGRPRI